MDVMKWAWSYPININSKILAVISAPRLAGLSIPNMANTIMDG